MSIIEHFETAAAPGILEEKGKLYNDSNFKLDFQLSNVVLSCIITELCIRGCWYQCFKSEVIDELLKLASNIIGFHFEFTGVLGTRRKYQTVKLAQLVVKTKTTNRVGGFTFIPKIKELKEEDDNLILVEYDEDKGGEKSKKVEELEKAEQILESYKIQREEGCRNYTLDEVNPDNDILDTLNLDEDEDYIIKEQNKPLPAPEQCILLAFCHYLYSQHTKRDELMLEQINALCTKILLTEGDQDQGDMLTANWLVFSSGLYFRNQTEFHRTHTRERASLQLQTLIAQYDDKIPDANHRVQYANTLCYPQKKDLEREFGLRMMKYGMVLTAFELFKRLKLWNEAIDCLITANKRRDALSLIKERLDVSETSKSSRCKLLCCLGDLCAENNPNDNFPESPEYYYNLAWELAGKRYGKVQRSLGWLYFNRSIRGEDIENNLKLAELSFTKSLEINPIFPSIWFTKGCVLMRLEKYEEATVCFEKSILHTSRSALGDEGAEGFGNLAACFCKLKKYKEAKLAIEEACKRSICDYRFWESRLGILMYLKDVYGICQVIKKLCDLDKLHYVNEGIFGALVKQGLESLNQDEDEKKEEKKEEKESIKNIGGNDFVECDGLFEDFDIDCFDNDEEIIIEKENLKEEKKEVRGKSFVLVYDMLEYITEKVVTLSFLWKLISIMQETKGDIEKAFESRLKEFRQLQTPLWEVNKNKLADNNDTSIFAQLMEELLQCLETLCSLEAPKKKRTELLFCVRNSVKRLKNKLELEKAAEASKLKSEREYLETKAYPSLQKLEKDLLEELKAR